MAFIEFKCPECGYETEEIVKSDGKYPDCPKCGAKLRQKLSGKCYTGCAGKSGGDGGHSCSGNCSCCSGCGH